MKRVLLFASLCSLCLCGEALRAGDWIHWRGPEQNGLSKETGLPDSFGIDTPGKDNLLWKQPYGGRSAPLVLKGRLYMIGGYDMALPTEGERVLCFDAETGEKKWEKRFNVFHTDIVSSRLGWTTLTADPEAERIYAHTTGGFLFCYDKDGNEVWKRQLTEEFGRVTGYGGRIASPIFDSGLVILGMVSGSWGDQARGHNRFVAFDGKTGAIVWWSSPTEDLIAATKATSITLRGTYYSNPVIAVINGQRLVISGAADGCIHALKVRTGERVWSHHFCAGVVNPSPVVDGDLVYICHGEENPEGGTIGRVICLDASKVVNKKPKLVWEKKIAKRFGLASPAIADGRLYVPDDASEMVCFNAKDGKEHWREKYGTVARGAPLVADGRLYVFDVNAKLTIFKLNGDRRPEDSESIAFRGGAGIVETNGTPIAVNGKLYFLTQNGLYCVGKPGTTNVQYKPLPAEPAQQPSAVVTAVRIIPADVLATAGQELKFEAKLLDESGREVAPPAGTAVKWSLVQPPLPPTAPKGATPPPALNGKLNANEATATVALGPLPRQQGVIEVRLNEKVAARARIRVAAQPPYTEDFEKIAPGGVPGGWVNVQAKYTVADLNGAKVLSKVNIDSRPPIARANGYITSPWASNYTIEADVMGTEVRGKFPDMGLVNSRYTLILDGKDDPSGKRQARLVTWEARPRLGAAAAFDWEANVWYRLKLTVDPGAKSGTVKAKVWKRGEAEPSEWTVTMDDPSPNPEGAAAVYAYISDPTINEKHPGSNVYFDNVAVTPNTKK